VAERPILGERFQIEPLPEFAVGQQDDREPLRRHQHEVVVIAGQIARVPNAMELLAPRT